MADEEVYYSAKHWAKKSEKFANETKDAKESAETAIALVEGFDTTVEQAKTAITSLATEEKNNIRTVGDEEETAVTNAGTTGVANVKAAETTGVANVNKATSDGVAQIQAEATGFVKTSGDQTIDGVKTFTRGTASVKVSRGDATYGEIMFTKNDGTRTGGVRNIQEPTGNTTMIYVTSDDGTAIKGNINLVFDGTTVKTYSPTPPASDNSTQIATTNWCYDPAKSTNLVHRTGNETVNGVKTFKNSMILNYNTNFIRSHNSDFNVTSAASTANGIQIQLQDYAGNASGLVENWSYTNGDKYMIMRCYSRVTGTQKQGQIGVGVRADGTIYTIAPTPPASDNSTQMATTAWVHNNKATIVGWGIPDYSSGVTISTESYTAPSAGLMSIFANIGNSNVDKKIKVNGNQVGLVYGWSGDWAGNANCFTFPIAKGDVVSELYTSGTNIFYPFKGVK